MKQTPKKKAIELINTFDDVEISLKVVNQILKLSGLPQYQIIFWREVENKLKELQTDNR